MCIRDRYEPKRPIKLLIFSELETLKDSSDGLYPAIANIRQMQKTISAVPDKTPRILVPQLFVSFLLSFFLLFFAIAASL